MNSFGNPPRINSDDIDVPAPVPQVPVAIVSPESESSRYADSTATETLQQLERVVSEFMIKYPGHTQRIPAMRPGEHMLIAFVRTMAASMAAKQEQLEQLNAEVLEAAKEKERFLANMSHEVRTPMNGIFGMVNLLLEMDLEPVQQEYLETVHSASESLLNILDDVLDYAKLNSNEMQLRPRQFDLNKLIRDVLWVYKPNADAKNVSLTATICESLPDHYILDDLRLKQILSNLVSNALKFTDEGSVSVTIQGISKSGRNQLLFQVQDTGVGIDEEAGKSLFAPFRQVNSEDERRYEGTGLGLAISKNLVELMGGRVWFESEPGRGTTFSFTADYELPKDLPLDERASLVCRAKVPNPREEQAANRKFRVLLVEDNKVNQKVASLTLQQLGCEVTIANNGQEAIDLADGPFFFDLICMDVNMPVMDGLGATSAIRRLDHQNSEAHILAMTGMAFEEDLEKCMRAGMNDVITKPLDISDLRQRIENLKSEVALSS